MHKYTFSRLLAAFSLLCTLHTAQAFHTIPCSNTTIQGAIDSILAEEKANGGADGVDFYIALGGGLVFNEPVVIDDNGTPGGVTIAIIGGLAIDPNDPNGCAASPGVFDGTTSVISAGGRFHQSAIQVTGHANVYLDALTLSGASLGGSGGGISFDGTGSLNLYGVNIANNTAGSGAGIHANGSAPRLGVNFHDLVLPSGAHLTNFIQDNAATNGPGGGMDLSGETFLSANDGELIVGANTATGDGGGIAFRGRGSLQLGSNAQLVGNKAGNGGGIFFAPTESTDVSFLDGVIVAGNTAQNDGGGVYVGNDTILHASATAAPTRVFANAVAGSSGCGGGIFVGATAQLYFSGAITGNSSAGDGGGLCGKSGTDDLDNVAIYLNGVSPQSPVTISNNTAAGRGGGIFCRAYETGVLLGTEGFNFCYIIATLFNIDGNSAADGTAIFAQAESNTLATHSFGPIITLKGACGGRAGCNEINGNFRSSASTQDGATIVVEEQGSLGASGIKLQNNTGGHLFALKDGFNSVNLQTALVTGNHSDGALIDSSSGSGGVTVTDSTFAHDELAGATIVRASNVKFHNDLIAETADAFDFSAGSNGTHDIADVLVNPFDSSPGAGSGTVVHATALFVDAANGNYRLAPYSPGIDVAPADVTVPTDLDGNPRDIDEQLIGNIDGPRDLGAYEFNGVLVPRACSASDEIFCTRFE